MERPPFFPIFCKVLVFVLAFQGSLVLWLILYNSDRRNQDANLLVWFDQLFEIIELELHFGVISWSYDRFHSMYENVYGNEYPGFFFWVKKPNLIFILRLKLILKHFLYTTGLLQKMNQQASRKMAWRHS